MNPWNLWESMKIYENLRNPWTCMGYMCFEKNICYIPYSKQINASHICPPKRKKFFKQREWNLMFSRKYWLWPAKRPSKSLLSWKPEMIPRSLQIFCPSRFPLKPQQKLSFWQKCWNPFFRQHDEFEKHEKWIWLRKLGLRTAVSKCWHHRALQLARLKTGSAMTHVRQGHKCCDRDWLG